MTDKQFIDSQMIRKTEILSQTEIDQLLAAIRVRDENEQDNNSEFMVEPTKVFREGKGPQYSFEELAKVNPKVAQEMIDNFKIMQMSFAEPYQQLANKIHEIIRKMDKISITNSARLDRIEKILRGGGDLLEDI
jgi:flagellar motor switch protein FliM